MRHIQLALVLILSIAGATLGDSRIVYTLETGGDNHAADWEAGTNPMPSYTSGVTDGTTEVDQGDDLNWAVRVSVGGTHSGWPGDGQPTLGAASLTFDLVILDENGNLLPDLGAAPMTCASGTPGEDGALDCQPTGKGFWS